VAKVLAIRADASPLIGTGHIMRCLALAQAWHDDGGQAVFITAIEAPTIEKRLRAEEMSIVHLPSYPGSQDDARQTVDAAREAGAHWLVVDGYNFDASYQATIKKAGLSLLFIDDNGQCNGYHADVVLNQNVYAKAELYQNSDSGTRLLLGTRYVLLRREFLKYHGWRREYPKVARRLLVTMGGADLGNATAGVIEALPQKSVDGIEAVVVVGGTNPHREQLEAAIRNSKVPIRLVNDVAKMSDLMAWADVAVSAGGSTCWELAFMGLPSIVLVLADNQLAVADHLNSAKISVNMGWLRSLPCTAITQELARLVTNKGLRIEMGVRGRHLVDGEGAARVLNHMKTSSKLRLRRAREDDCRLLWEWASDPHVRAWSFSSASIPWKEHVTWFTQKLRDPNCFIFIAMDDQDRPIGQVRFDMTSDCEAEIGLSIDGSNRGERYGSLLIELSVAEMFRGAGVKTINAYIRRENQASCKAFENARFNRVGLEMVKGHAALHYSKSTSEPPVPE